MAQTIIANFGKMFKSINKDTIMEILKKFLTNIFKVPPSNLDGLINNVIRSSFEAIVFSTPHLI